MTKEAESLQERIGYRFSHPELLEQALIHSSYVNEHQLTHADCNERLEFLGDAVLELLSSDVIYQKYPTMTEGDMTQLRASFVCEQALAEKARKLDLAQYLFLGKGEEQSGGRNRDGLVADAMEALIGAIYLDGGIAAAGRFLSQYVLDHVSRRQE